MPNLFHRGELTPIRKLLRNRATCPEVILWRYLRRRGLDKLKFRRQESIGRYVVDFYCPKRRLAIEVDGAGHDEKNQQIYDQERTVYLNNLGIKVVRFKNGEVLGDIEEVLETIRRVVRRPP